MPKHFDLINHLSRGSNKLRMGASIVTLTGSSGTADITINGIVNPTVATYATSLTNTAAAWVAANYDYYKQRGYNLTASAGVILVSPANSWDNANRFNATITTLTGNLSGTYTGVLTVDALKAKLWDVSIPVANLIIAKPIHMKNKESVRVILVPTVNCVILAATGVTLNGATGFTTTLTANTPYAMEMVYDTATGTVVGTVNSSGDDLTIGDAPTPVGTRTAGSVLATNTINENIEALDSAIGSEEQITGTPVVIDETQSVMQMLDALDAQKTVRSLKRTIAGVAGAAVGTITVSDTPVADETIQIGETEFTFVAARSGAGEITINADNDTQVTNIITALTADSTDVVGTDGTGATVVVTAVDLGTAGNALAFSSSATGIAMDGDGFLGGTTAGVDPGDADFNFESAGNQTAQAIDLGAVLPAMCKLMHVFTVTEEGFAEAVSLDCVVGVSSGDDSLISTADLVAEDTVGDGQGFNPLAVTLEDRHIFLTATPGANWSLVISGKLAVYITFMDLSRL